MATRKHVVVVWPTGWEASELARPKVEGEYRFSSLPLAGLLRPSSSLVLDVWGQLRLLRAEAFVEASVESLRSRPPDGVIGTEDHLGASLAAAIAERLGVPGPSPRAVLTCQHKHRSRLVQAACVPEATPRFARVDPEAPSADGVGYPCFVKPVRGSFSVFARRVEDERDLRRHVRLSWRDRRVWDLRQRPFEGLARLHLGSAEGSRSFLAEELLGGRHVSVEGYCRRGEVRVLCAIDAAMYPGTDSFRRFTLPSTLPAAVLARVEDVARRAMIAVGFDEGMFDIEMFWDPARDRTSIIEINPRACPQFADLMEKVHGANGFDVLLSIATNEAPAWSPGAGRFGCAASFVLRIFGETRVVRLPSHSEIARSRVRSPDLRVHIFSREGATVAGRVRALHDCSSIRIATVHLGGADREDLMRRLRLALSELPFVVDPPCDFAEALTRD